ncbi:MAG TPA: RNA-guided endonuclease IscB [Candidatus Baltobacteraceae bacterium]|nr:RNA-guided endonuclease IscB [Candidatus Baltobacteraceae bacterium]
MVFVLDKRRQPLMPCSEKRARLLLRRGRARVHRLHPFCIRLTDRVGGTIQPLALKIDPGSKATGLALVHQSKDALVTLALIELRHRGNVIRENLQTRKGFRRGRRSRNLRHRQPRFDNRRKGDGWLAPSLRHRLETTMTWVRRLRALAPVAHIVEELVRFDLQQMENPTISGVEYQHGTLCGYELREYLLEKFDRTCVYCDAHGVPLQIDHVVPKARGGSNRVSNLVIACGTCNQDKADQVIDAFLSRDAAKRARIAHQLKTPLRDAAAVNAMRWALLESLTATGLPVETGSGGRTKFNRTRLGLPKSHALDALCTGNLDAVERVEHGTIPTLVVTAMGHGSHRRTRSDASGFPVGYCLRTKNVRGFRTGDLVVADVPSGKKYGRYAGRVAIRATGSFNVQTKDGVVQGIHHRHCRLTQRADGYRYQHERTPLLSDLKFGVSAA